MWASCDSSGVTSPNRDMEALGDVLDGNKDDDEGEDS
jgi:hypothetical protein